MANSVTARMNYSVDNGRPIDYYFYEPGPDRELNPPGTDVRPVQVEDGWPRANAFSADREGFEIHRFDGGFRDYADANAVKSVFYEQVVGFVKRHTGAARVVVFDHTIRQGLPTAPTGKQIAAQRPAVPLVHSDYTPKSGPQRVHDILPAEADELLKHRVAFYNVWHPLCRRVEELPLGLCDATTSSSEDMLRMDLKYRDRTGEIYVMRWSPRHQWFYFPLMTVDDALLLKTFDSETDGRARFMGHSAFEDPTSPPDAPRRQSIEVRTMAFF